MAKVVTAYKITYQGRTYNRTPYTITIRVIDSKINAIDILGKPNLFVADLCRNFAVKKPANVEDVASVIKLEMLKHNEYVMEVRN